MVEVVASEGDGAEVLTLAVGVAVCGGVLGFTDAETALLRALPSPGEPLEPATWCELESGHEGLHHGLGQISGPTWWWMRWDDSGDRRELVDAGFCGVGVEAGGGTCSLPAGHVGRHGFELDGTD